MYKYIVGMDNIIIPFKNRKIHFQEPVFIYRNLHNNEHNKYSIKQRGLVCGHTNQIMLHDVEFIVNQSGRERVIKTHRKNVHAYIKGKISLEGGMGIGASDLRIWTTQVTYNPYNHAYFQGNNYSINSFIIEKAKHIIINKIGVQAAYPS